MRPGIKKPALLERLRQSGVRITPSRRAVVDDLHARAGNFSIDDLVRALPLVGRATVFRTMKLLVQADAVCRVPLEDGSVRYRIRGREEHHHHLVCTGCGEMRDFAGCDVDSLAGELGRRTDYEITGHRLELYGVCPSCRDEERVEA